MTSGSIIYGLIDGDTLELRYVGQTCCPKKRLRQHSEARHNPHLNNWLRTADISMITLERDPADLDATETRWIRELREQGARLLNLSPGGNGQSPETCAKISASKTGHHYPKLRAAKTGHSVSAETRAKTSATLKGHAYYGGAPPKGHPPHGPRSLLTGRFIRKEEA